ncbi:AraC family transcriptional regulator [Galbitalea sp. SE-J8]|uniref:AraC family transcriptional regulator n=1 Tax=Galbitalea sp. SE-J8 TaxID=3054952 RepID=UPI00259CDD72|nr:AraC family transcriptional regulator [Galbitalea sp. SE-J8]MDM4763829.1 AraC family transcriptional regulator [Galbitalea sp. SE-J8]
MSSPVDVTRASPPRARARAAPAEYGAASARCSGMVIALREAPPFGATPSDAALHAREWEMSLVQRLRVDAVTAVAVGSGPLWTLVAAGSAELRVGGERFELGGGDAALVSPGAVHRVIARAGTEIVTTDLRAVLTLAHVPNPLVIRGYAERQRAIPQLLETCPLSGACSNPIWARAYANIVGASMLTLWMEERGPARATDAAVASVVAALTRAPGESWTLERMARIAHLSRSALTARFTAALGKPPSDVLRDLRMNAARDLLASSTSSVGSVAFAVGYGSTAAFSRAFAAHHGTAPQAWRDARAAAFVPAN